MPRHQALRNDLAPVKLTPVILCRFTATCLAGLIIIMPIEAIAAPTAVIASPSFYQRQINKLTYPNDTNLGLPAFPIGKSDTQASQTSGQPTPPVQKIPETLTQPETDVTLVKIRNIAPALIQLSNQLKGQIKQQITLKIKPQQAATAEQDSKGVVLQSHPDPYALIAAARNRQNPLKRARPVSPATALSRPIRQLNQRVVQAKSELEATLSQQPQQLRARLTQAKADLQSHSKQQINTHLGQLQIALDKTIRQPLRRLLEKVELAAHRNAEKLR